MATSAAQGRKGIKLTPVNSPPMRSADAEPLSRLRIQWERLSAIPGGKWLFSKALGVYVPYTGSIGARVEELAPGYARVSLRERRALRNHLHSVHAVALVNLAEVAGNLAMLYAMPADARFIVSALSIEYLKKARGAITAECRCAVPETSERRAYDNPVVLRNEHGETVATALIKSLVGPKPPLSA
ncbi:MAG TPA: hotdog fold domain-containing protein [Myxococcaceae bacterium]|nr:hotdog fold domain-containing protein [Myxococcaceae bacterium]